jgi:hypothetical protein
VRCVHHLSLPAQLPAAVGRPKIGPGHEDDAPLALCVSCFRQAEVHLPVYSRSLTLLLASLNRGGGFILDDEGVGLFVAVVDTEGHAGVGGEIPGSGWGGGGGALGGEAGGAEGAGVEMAVEAGQIGCGLAGRGGG